MASRLEELYTTLEDKVRDKTHSLDEKNRQLSALYAVTSYLHEANELAVMSRGFIEQLMKLSGADAGSIRPGGQQTGLEPVAQIGLPETLQQADDCQRINGCYCGEAVEQAQAIVHLFRSLPTTREEKSCQQAGFATVAIFHIRANQQNVGLFTLYFRQTTPLAQHDQFLIETLCNHLGVAIENLRLAARDRQFAVSEERNLMAQGLHDSIAQSLSFLNLQVQMLENELPHDLSPQARENLTFIQAGVQECYEDVRELLLNFRTRISKQDFTAAVESLLQRFEAQARVLTQCDIAGNGLPLTPDQQLQVIFILQEALSNVRKHAHAQRVDIRIRNEEDFVMEIADDGCGFDDNLMQVRKNRHVGLSIMQERAARIHANIQFTPRAGSGTIVTLTLPRTERQAA
ncbi:GAF domain-containing sensor histidine kinase [Paludibacterium denitrificans]|uniref:GAF domain-containing sensor histidine kinase n=1 Tax=Paludibacterium denitrificans TaxID=2675226 RepID=UPI001E54ED6B|nr:histidine kinase [Paludibacterium denitrificans]